MTEPIVVVADNRSLSLGLTGLHHDVIDLRPNEVDQWQSEGAPAALLVVGVQRPDDALEIMTAATGTHPGLPVLLVASDAAGWSEVTIDGGSTVVLPLPVTRLSLVAAAQRLIKRSAEPAPSSLDHAALDHEPQELPEPAPPPPSPAAAAPHTAEDTHAAPHDAPAHHDDDRDSVKHMVAARSTDALRQRLASRPHPSPPPQPAHVDLVHDLLVEQPPSAAAAVSAMRPHPPAPTTEVSSDVRSLAESLLGRIDELYDIRDAASAVIEECLAAATASHGVAMLPDGDLWRVCGGVGARPLEWRYVVEPDSWLVATVVTGNKGIIIEDSDIARQRLGGAPLVHHSQLMAAPIPATQGFVLIAREGKPFTEDELSAVASISHDAGPLLSEAIVVRTLARALSDFRAVDE